jgi:branched-chain amino acid aminotransferase
MNAGTGSSILMYGKGVFSTLAIRNRELFLWSKHWKRLRRDAEIVGIDLSGHSESAARSMLDDLVIKENLDNGRARITFIDESPSSMWSTGEPKTTLLLTVAEKRVDIGACRLGISRTLLNSTSPIACVKSCNYLEHLMAYEEARDRGFDEALRINEKGHVASACMANLFWEKDGKLFTPSLSTGCLPGTTREFVLENFECEEVESGIEVLGSADRIFLTSAGLGVVAAAEFNGRKLDTSDHPLLNLIPN